MKIYDVEIKTAKRDGETLWSFALFGNSYTKGTESENIEQLEEVVKVTIKIAVSEYLKEGKKLYSSGNVNVDFIEKEIKDGQAVVTSPKFLKALKEISAYTSQFPVYVDIFLSFTYTREGDTFYFLDHTEENKRWASVLDEFRR